jgi:hypothetical protein
MRETTRLRALWMRTAGQPIVDGEAPTAAEISAALLRRMKTPAPRATGGRRRHPRSLALGSALPTRRGGRQARAG